MPDCHRFPSGQAPGARVGFVIVFCGRFQDHLAGFFTDLWEAIECATHCGLRHAKLLGQRFKIC